MVQIVPHEWDPDDKSNPWNDLCICGHKMWEHILDWDADPEIDCTVEGCYCREFDHA